MTLFHLQMSKDVNQDFDIFLVRKKVSTIMTGVVVIPRIGKDLAITALVLILILQAGIPEVSLINDRPIRLGIWRVHRLPSQLHLVEDGRHRGLLNLHISVTVHSVKVLKQYQVVNLLRHLGPSHVTLSE